MINLSDKRKGEILAPVGGEDMLFAAVRSGADAVYLGAKDFSARRNAENFDLPSLKKAIEYCHINGVKAYLTLNILIKESELADAFSLAQDAYNLGIDGIIVEDIGLARVLHEKIPDLRLHASTQMTVHSPSALPILKGLGFSRVVVSREMSREELKILCRKAKELGLTVEVFVHGALCMSMSGQCLLSAFLGSRSGNRGLCAGPCRLPFAAENGTGYDLSLKDLSLLRHIGELYEMGVYSFKIEGRMKRPEYVAAAVTAANEALYSGYIDASLDKTLRDVFSRQGFTDGYYTSRLGPDMFGIRTKDDVMGAETAFPKLHELYRKEFQRVPVTINAEFVASKPISLTVTDGVNTASAFGEPPQTAKNRATTREDIEIGLTKLGSTAYLPEKVDISLSDGVFVSAGEINSLRRDACLELDKLRSAVSHEPSQENFTASNIKEYKKSPQKLFARFENTADIPKNTNVDGIILALECEPVLPDGFDGIKIADIPRGISSEETISKRLELFKSAGFTHALCGNLAAVTLAKNTGFAVIADAGLNLANSESLVTAEKMGISAAVMSAEELICDLKAIKSPIPRGIVVYGNIPLMLTRNCPLKNGIKCADCDKNGVLTDRLGTKFPVRCRMGYSEVLNSVPIWLADKKTDYADFDFAVLYFTAESKDRAAKIIEAYRTGAASDTKHTRGLYYRGTI